MKTKILFLTPYPHSAAPSQRFRFEQYFEALKDANIGFDFQSFLISKNWKIFYQSSKLPAKIFSLVLGFLQRVILLPKVMSYDYIFIHRELTPVGPPVFEFIIAKILKRKIVYDFDDAIWLTDREEEGTILRLLKWRKKVPSICSWAYKVSCGNEYLCNYARQFNQKVFYNPTTIDTLTVHNPQLFKKSNTNKIIIGWTGSHSTLKYLCDLEQVFQQLEEKYKHIELWVIADRPPELKLKCLQYKKWSIETEISDMIQFDIGIMPLPNDEWSMGKCGFKALQYMALEIPTIAQAVGVNTSIVKDGSNGLLVDAAGKWMAALSQLIEDESLRMRLGKEGRKTVELSFSVQSNKANFLSLFT